MGVDENLSEDMPQAACVLIWRTDGKILAVSKPDNQTIFTMPGGKLDEGETPEASAMRELKEETGLSASNLKEIFFGYDNGHLVTTFEGEIEGDIHTEESGVVRWVDPSVLAYGPSGEYNRSLFDLIGIEY
jgi:8-oxo-dGTP pyrophosphatase MutT (NUDIX family)